MNKKTDLDSMKNIDQELAYSKSLDTLKRCASKKGFLASTTRLYNYCRVWARDGVITGLASLLTNNSHLIDTFAKTLDTLAENQGKHGQIPSNVCIFTGAVSYGMTAGRVDASLWYVIGCGQYFKHTGDRGFLEKHKKHIDSTMQILEAWEFNQKDFIYVPMSGDWADELPREGYLLYDQLLYYWAIEEYIYILETLGENSFYWATKQTRLKSKIHTNFWLDTDEIDEKYVYHPDFFYSFYKRHKERQEYWYEGFSPKSFHSRFDALANILTILLGFSDFEKTERIIEYVSGIIGAGYLVPAFYPIITPKEKVKWEEISHSYSFHFKNTSYHSHNGGLWPMVTGFYIAALAKEGRNKSAVNYLNSLNYANSLDKESDSELEVIEILPKNNDDSKDWGFYEYHHGLNKTPEGTRQTCWSAAAAIIGYHAVKGNCLLSKMQK